MGFIKFVLIPLFEAVAKIFPQMKEMVKALHESHNRYNELKLNEDEKSKQSKN